MSLRVAVIESVGGHGGMNFYDFSLCQGIVNAGAGATLFTCDKTVVNGDEGFSVKQPYRGIYGKSQAWVRGLRFLSGSLHALPWSRIVGAASAAMMIRFLFASVTEPHLMSDYGVVVIAIAGALAYLSAQRAATARPSQRR